MQGRPIQPDAVVVGSGPNGLAAAITIARAGRSVILYEAEDTIGGGTRSAQLTLPGFIHDICSCVHPMASSSPFFKEVGLEKFGLRWIYPELALAHPLDDGDAAVITNPFAENAAQFGEDERIVRDVIGPFVESWTELSREVLAPLHVPSNWALMARFARRALPPASRTAARFKTKKARAVFAGMAAHAILPFDRWVSGAFGVLMWSACYAVGWPFAAGGSQSIADALANAFQGAGGEIVIRSRVTSLDELPKARAILFDVTPRQFVKIAGNQLKESARARFGRFRYGPGVFKLDWALDGPIPWNSPECVRAGTVHVGGTFEEIAESEAAVWRGEHPERPFVILAQPSLFDPSRAPEGKHTAWAYCHVPNGSSVDMGQQIEWQIERFARGFRQRILARAVMCARDLEQHNANLVGGDIGAGSLELKQLFMRPTSHLYRTPLRNVFLCSASTPPGPGVHGMCGYHAAQRALGELL